MTTSISPTIRYIFRCRAGHAWTRDYDMKPLLWDGKPMGQAIPHRLVGGKTLYPGSMEERYCPEAGCGGFASYLRPVRATGSDAPCGTSCQEAVGPECKCSCQGASHGIKLLRKEIEKGQEFLAARFILPRPGIDTTSETWGHLR